MLTAAHTEQLTRFRISLEYLEACGVRSVTDAECRELLGVHGYEGYDLSGIYFPSFDPLTGTRTGARVRLDTAIGNQKYLSEQGNRHLFIAPCPKEWLSDTSIPVLFVEAEKSALAIADLCRRTNTRIIVVALGGCWGWRRKCELRELPEGGKESISGPSPDFGIFNWTGRPAIILFDGNIATNFSVQAARGGLTTFLSSEGAQVLYAEVPNNIPSVNGPDDLFTVWTDDEIFSRLLNKAAPPPAGKKEEQETQAVELVNGVIDKVELFHDADQTGYAVLEVDGHKETGKINSRAFKQYICHQFYLEHGKIPGAQSVLNAVNLLEAKARFDGAEERVHVRVAEYGGALWLDLVDKFWRAVRIDAAGWKVVDNPPVRFLRPPGLLPLPVPMDGGSINDLKPFTNFATEEHFILFVAWLVAAYRPSGPYPVAVVSSEHGSCKTTTSRIARRFIDPNTAPLRSAPKEPRDLIIQATNGYVIGLDNISKLPEWLSDSLSRISTGDGFSTRALYTDSDEQIFAACRPVIMNGITAIPHRPDLLDRSLILELAVMPDSKRRDEEEFWKDFEKVEPLIMGALLQAVATAFGRVKQVKLDRMPRMADFARWVTAAEPALPWPEGKFIRIYAANRQEAIEDILHDDPIADMCKAIAPWEGGPSDFLKLLNTKTPLEVRDRKNWYDTPEKVSHAIKRLTPALRRVGIDVKRGHRVLNKRQIIISRIADAEDEMCGEVGIEPAELAQQADLGVFSDLDMPVDMPVQPIGSNRHDNRHDVNDSKQKPHASSASVASSNPTLLPRGHEPKPPDDVGDVQDGGVVL